MMEKARKRKEDLIDGYSTEDSQATSRGTTSKGDRASSAHPRSSKAPSQNIGPNIYGHHPIQEVSSDSSDSDLKRYDTGNDQDSITRRPYAIGSGSSRP